MRNTFKKQAAKLGLVGSAAVAFVNNAMAAVDTAAVGTSLTAAQASGESVGALVIGVVASLIVVGVIIGLIKKI